MPEKKVRFHLYTRHQDGYLQCILKGKSEKPPGGTLGEVFNVNGKDYVTEDRLEPSGVGDDGDAWMVIVHQKE